MSNFLCAEAYFAVPKWRFLHKIKWLGRTAVYTFFFPMFMFCIQFIGYLIFMLLVKTLIGLHFFY